jgi:hypothetical protein
VVTDWSQAEYRRCHGLGGVSVEGWGDVAVDVGGDGSGGVPEALRHDLERYAGIDAVCVRTNPLAGSGRSSPTSPTSAWRPCARLVGRVGEGVAESARRAGRLGAQNPAEVALVGEAEVDREAGEVVVALRDAFQGGAGTEAHAVARDRVAGDCPEGAAQVMRRDVETGRQLGQRHGRVGDQALAGNVDECGAGPDRRGLTGGDTPGVRRC